MSKVLRWAPCSAPRFPQICKTTGAVLPIHFRGPSEGNVTISIDNGARVPMRRAGTSCVYQYQWTDKTVGAHTFQAFVEGELKATVDQTTSCK